MANVGAFKNLGENDIVSTRTLLHEAIPLTGTIVSGTYNDNNIKFHTHGMFQTVYDYPYLSSSANHIFDITYGMSTNSAVYDTSVNQYKKKKNIYNQMAQILVGYDVTGSVLEFDADGNILAGGSKLRDNYIIPFSRLLVKDEVKKGTFTMLELRLLILLILQQENMVSFMLLLQTKQVNCFTKQESPQLVQMCTTQLV